LATVNNNNNNNNYNNTNNNKVNSPSPRILNNPSSGGRATTTTTNNNNNNSNNNNNNWTLTELNVALGLSPPSTTPSSSTKRTKSLLNFPQPSTTKAPESKNSSVSVSDVSSYPIKVFFVWLSTFFV
jgi:hypothetical protein